MCNPCFVFVCLSLDSVFKGRYARNTMRINLNLGCLRILGTIHLSVKNCTGIIPALVFKHMRGLYLSFDFVSFSLVQSFRFNNLFLFCLPSLTMPILYLDYNQLITMSRHGVNHVCLFSDKNSCC